MAIGNSAPQEAVTKEKTHEAINKQEKETKIAPGTSNGVFPHLQNHDRIVIHGLNDGEVFQCPKCDKHFGNHQILQLHLRVHNSNGESGQQVLLSNKGMCLEASNGYLQNGSQNKKLIGLTKVRLEDCLRCDACSCIYLDESDYNKHMKNFHRHDSPKKHKQKKGCRSCCKHCNCKGNHQHQSVQKERGNNNLFHYSLKDRWSKMVSRRLTPEEIRDNIKADPDFDPASPHELVDYSHLLSQVEVKIKTEPTEDSEFEQSISLASG